MSIYEAMMKVREHIGPIQKQQVQSFKAFTVEDIYSTLRPLFTQYGIIVTPEVKDAGYHDTVDDKGRRVVDCRIVAEWTFTAEDGTSITAIGAAEGRDYQDKATNKALQQAFKYTLIQMFQISTGEIDPDAEAIEVTTDVQHRVWAVQQKVLDQYEGDKALAAERWQTLLDTVGVEGEISAADIAALEAAVV